MLTWTTAGKIYKDMAKQQLIYNEKKAINEEVLKQKTNYWFTKLSQYCISQDEDCIQRQPGYGMDWLCEDIPFCSPHLD